MASVENLVLESISFENTRTVRIWRAIAAVACVIAVVVTALFIWQVLKDSPNKLCSAEQSESANGGIQTGESRSELPKFSMPCPRNPSLLPLPESIPKHLTNALNKIKELVNSTVNNTAELPAISLNIFYQDRVLLNQHFGSKEYRSRNPPDAQTVYRIGSVSKLFAVLMVYKFYEDGLIDSLDDPLSKYAPAFYIQNPFTERNITIRQIASQMSGLPREAPCFYTCVNATTANQLSALRNRSLVLPPGTMPSYSNLGYALLGRLLSQNLLENQTFEEWVIERILKPLNMTDSGFNITQKQLKNLAYPHNPNGTRMPFLDIYWAAPSGQMFSTSEDMVKFGKMFTQPSKQNLFKPASLREMMYPMDIASDGVTLWGAPWEMSMMENYLVRNKGGAIDSYSTQFAIVPELQLGMSLLISSGSFLLKRDPLNREILKILLPALNETLVEREKSSHFPLDPEPYIGEYTITELEPLTRKPNTFSGNITVKQNFLLVSYHNGHKLKQFEVHYIGKTLIFQARFWQPLFSCYRQRLGRYEDLHFLPFSESGVSPGFNVPGGLLSATRAS
ncbi:LOW QUALITY PROTEIN: putative beta-lactamase-like 1 [Acropora millepora]|uniref:LOW QUALITY PROTEIN: putative beta-lactamase-like 1 n=1 Tax=Acropora millepora TaxID=45264 RepID=UPI001CF11A70|nr:LOW QUALITY PROTEIN: putative beta-lactamase-like 1 [Acropora millepora]